MNAERLIDELLEARMRIVKGDFLSPREVLGLRSKQGVLVRGKRAVIVDISSFKDRGGVEMLSVIYIKGAKSFGREQSLVVPMSDRETPIQLYKKIEIEGMTKGMKNVLQKQQSKTSCGSCGFKIPKYPGAYPAKCPECDAALSTR